MSTTTKSAEWHAIVDDFMRRSNDYTAAVAWADTCERNAAAAKAEREARDAAWAAVTDDQSEAIADEAMTAITERWPGVKTAYTGYGAYACIRDEHASITAYWRPYERDWTANITEGTPRGEVWAVDGHASALAAVDAVRALVASAAMDLRATADKTVSLLTLTATGTA